MRGGDGMNVWPQWRNACVVRAQTIAANLRMVEFAVEGGLPAFGPDASTRVRARESGAFAAGAYVCVNVGEGRMRVLVAGPEDDRGARFMWSLVEGARVRLTVPAAQASGSSGLPRLIGADGVRICLDPGAQLPAASSAGLRARAANANAPSRQHLSF